MTIRNFAGACAVAAVVICAAAPPASALPSSFNNGAFNLSASTSDTPNLNGWNGLLQISPTTQSNTLPTGDFASNPPPATFPFPNPTWSPGGLLDATFASDFDFSNALFGAFTASSVSLFKTTVNGSLVTVAFDVTGTFVPGTSWLNSGANFTASESWLLSQTNGRGNTISMAGTFDSPANVAAAPPPVPEPATLTLLGFALLAAGTLRARKSQAVSA